MAEQNLRAEIIGYDSGWGCRDFGCEDGPHAIAADRIIQQLGAAGVQTKWRGPMGLKNLADHAQADDKKKVLPVLVACLKRLHAHVTQALENNHVPIVIGGDHASAVGTWSAAARGAEGKFGLIWLDAHLDAHTPETAQEGKWGGWWHGQPVSALLGQGQHELKTLGGARAKIAAQHLSIIGPHSFEPGEEAFVKKNGIRVYYLDEVKQRGFPAVFAEALDRARAGTEGFGLSIDLDCFHPLDAPGVGTPEVDGLSAADVLPIVRTLARAPGFRALEIAEYNPHNDKERKTAQLIEKLVASVFAKD